ncbi:MAG TPA: adenylate/guanylate cyclase domain-containing protein [Candidatus Binatia bacterium]|nr:adenylate/guanylate cyclase domain-containing protein [Candidatus Binatia bacterium]
MASPDPWAPLAEILLGKAALTPAEVAREAGLGPEATRRLWRALGFPPVADDERLFTRADVDVLRAVGALVAMQSAHPDDVVQLTRVIGQSLARIADAQVTATADRIDGMRGDAPFDDGARQDVVRRIELLLPSLERFLSYVWRRHLLAAVRRRDAAPSGGGQTLVVGFADLVGFTGLSQAIAPGELTQIVDRFEALAYEHIVERGGRVAKMIGDEVMFAAHDAGSAAEIALALADAYARESDLPGVRVALARGPTLSWEGDLYGPTVNLASRLVNLARENTVLVSEDLGGELHGDPRFETRHLRPVSLRGIGRARMWVLRRARRR